MISANKVLKEVFDRIDSHLLYGDTPSRYLKNLLFAPEFDEYPFTMLRQLSKVEQSPKYHPEGSAWNHTMQVIDAAAGSREKSANPRAFMWAALLHDIGKAETTKRVRGRITSYNHDKVGAKRAREFMREFTRDEALISHVEVLVRYHMHLLYVLKDLPFSDMDSLRREADVNEVALLGLCDRLGRKDADEALERTQMEMFLHKAKSERKTEVI